MFLTKYHIYTNIVQDNIRLLSKYGDVFFAVKANTNKQARDTPPLIEVGASHLTMSKFLFNRFIPCDLAKML